ncbi:MAG TPA: hypothetical protein VEQ66_07750 [Propionibacteriaceae bacterium]|nr:hypothetical protein [Propionibacteriaceae bacterium]
MHQLLLHVVALIGAVAGDAVTGPLRYLPYLLVPAVVAAASIAVGIFFLRRTSKSSD